jgi:hypothetical protein
VRAANSNGTETVLRRKFVADDKGPVISDTAPAAGSMIGRVVTISAKISDSAGVLDSSIVAVVAHGDVMFEVKLQPAAAAGSYQALFDTSRLPKNAIFPSISFRASDSLGNESSVGYLLSLDNTPPIADLDPPAFVMERKKNDLIECSWPFDPMGPDAVSDLSTRGQLFDIRARVEDDGNSPLTAGADYIPISGVDDGRVQLLILDDTSRPLVVDTDGDGLCDAVNPLLTPTTTPMSATDALLINMVPINPAGGADFKSSPPDICGNPGTDIKSPDPFCDTSGLLAVIPPHAFGATAAVYGIPPIVNDHAQCLGRQLDALGNHVSDGWICLAVAVADKLGNTQVSRPIRVCVDKDGQGDECGVNRPAPPDCTGTLTAAKPVPQVDATRHCQPWRSFTYGWNYYLPR